MHGSIGDLSLVDMPISKGAKKIFEVLDRNLIEGYLIGGCVRDFLLGFDRHDYDFAAGEDPHRLLEIFKNAGLKVFDIGMRFGTIGVRVGGEFFEITSFREEGGYKTFRKPESVSFTKNFDRDVKRRDFSINALAYHPKKGVVDLCGGIEDLKRRILRSIGRAEERFLEDALRILRGVGFVARFDLSIDEETKKAMLSLAHLLEHISKERITSEFVKILTALCDIKKTREIFSEFEGIFDGLFGSGFSALALEKGRYFTDANIELKIALLFLENKAALNRLMLSKKQQAQIKAYMQWLEVLDSFDAPELKYKIKKLLNKESKGVAIEWMGHFIEALYLDVKVLEAYREIVQKGEAYRLCDLAISGKMLAEINISGKRCGEILEHLLDLVMQGGLDNTQEELLRAAKSMMDSEF